ncbi:MAG: hypothetical protein HY720_14695 [Planctomycetes bacterium]|nr:hypothetical protein [Planctomycetota bacterium]
MEMKKRKIRARREDDNSLEAAQRDLTRAQAQLVASHAMLEARTAGFHDEMRQMRREMVEEVTEEVTRRLIRYIDRRFAAFYESIYELIRDKVGFRPPAST